MYIYAGFKVGKQSGDPASRLSRRDVESEGGHEINIRAEGDRDFPAEREMTRE